MKKSGVLVNIYIFIMLIAVLTVTMIAALNLQTVYADEISDPVVVILSPTVSDKEVTIQANLSKNTGLSGLTLEIEYDSSAMTLTNVEKGSALSSLDYITTNTKTDKGYAILPFKLNWSGDANDSTTGKLITMHFAIKDGAKDGNYNVTLKAEKDKAVTYLDSDGLHTKSILISGVDVVISDDGISATTQNADNGQKSINVALVVSLSVVGGVLLAGGIALVIIEKKKSKAWERID
ncbi:MAG: hypothetical protein E7338_06315 [Clostridiales bacterium]|nr:hypothetical protein [Clostridiales bacterium]